MTSAGIMTKKKTHITLRAWCHAIEIDDRVTPHEWNIVPFSFIIIIYLFLFPSPRCFIVSLEIPESFSFAFFAIWTLSLSFRAAAYCYFILFLYNAQPLRPHCNSRLIARCFNCFKGVPIVLAYFVPNTRRALLCLTRSHSLSSSSSRILHFLISIVITVITIMIVRDLDLRNNRASLTTITESEKQRRE